MQLYLTSCWISMKKQSENKKDSDPSFSLPEVSILVAFRNEAKFLPTLLEALLNQDYKGKIQYFLINDHSEDNSRAVVEAFGLNSIQLIDLPGTIYGKKSAIQFGLTQITTPFVLLTDADCKPGRSWVSTMINEMMDKEVDFLGGMVSIESNQPSFLSQFQEIDVAAMMMVTAAGIQSNIFYMANGANMGINWTKVSNFKLMLQNGWASGDDMAMVESIAIGGGKIAFCLQTEALVKTKPEESWTALANQRIRWGSKNKGSNQKWLKIALGIGYLQSLTILMAVIGLVATILLGQQLFLVFVIGVPFRILGDLILFANLRQDFNINTPVSIIFPMSIVHSIYISIVGTLSLFPIKYNWKGRVSR
jgi:biofilm PGA synthesis N-glycosyltransferase PgaC